LCRWFLFRRSSWGRADHTRYESQPRLVYALTHWFKEHPNKEQSKKMDSKLQVPSFANLSRALVVAEELVVAQPLNPGCRQERSTGNW
jgi:hypothetical protein